MKNSCFLICYFSSRTNNKQTENQNLILFVVKIVVNFIVYFFEENMKPDRTPEYLKNI